jgi:hypothetical protein
MGRNSGREKTVRCVNLFDLRQSKHNLPSIVDTLRFLARVTFQIDRLEILVLGELGSEITEIGDRVIVRLPRGENRIRWLASLERVHCRMGSPRTPRGYANVKCSLCEVFGCSRHRLPAI